MNATTLKSDQMLIQSHSQPKALRVRMLVMPSFARMLSLPLLTVLFVGAACNKMPSPFTVKDRSPHADSDAPFDPPNTYPEWAYDSQSYVKPPQELTPEPKVNVNDPLHYFTKGNVVMIRRPEGYTPEEIPRVAIWYTDNNGFHWNKAGYFGREQTFFPFEAPEDGDYGIRFVGPGQDPALHSLPYPERVYHVDTALPDVVVTVEPEKTWYNVGETVTISWKAEDAHLIEYPVRIGRLLDFTADGANALELQRDLADEGQITYTIPEDALDHEARFRVDALDRAGNLGVAISFALQVVPEEQEDVSELEGGGEIAKANVGPATDASEANALAYYDGINTPALKQTSVGPAKTPVSSVKPTLAEGDAALHEPSTLGDADFDSVAIDASLEPTSTGGAAPLPMATIAARAAEPEAQLVWDAAATGATVGDTPFPLGRTNGATTMTPVNEVHIGKPDIAVSHEATPDGDGFQPRSDAILEEYFTVPQRPVQSEPEPAKPAEPSARSIMESNPAYQSIGLTHADGLLVPMPATIAPGETKLGTVLAHPWRSLTDVWPVAIQTVWLLPRPNFQSKSLNELFEGRFLAAGKITYPVSEPAPVNRTVVSAPDAVLSTEVNIQP